MLTYAVYTCLRALDDLHRDFTDFGGSASQTVLSVC
jgi:hypothetical protein